MLLPGCAQSGDSRDPLPCMNCTWGEAAGKQKQCRNLLVCRVQDKRGELQTNDARGEGSHHFYPPHSGPPWVSGSRVGLTPKHPSGRWLSPVLNEVSET